MADHIDPEVLAAYLEGKLPKVEEASTLEHLARCPQCLGELVNTSRTLRELRRLRIVKGKTDDGKET